MVSATFCLPLFWLSATFWLPLFVCHFLAATFCLPLFWLSATFVCHFLAVYKRYCPSVYCHFNVNYQQVNMPLLPHEKTLTCPYNPSHQILPSRFGRHLWKCSRSYTGDQVVSCKYGCKHIPVHALSEHDAQCPLKKFVEELKALAPKNNSKDN